MISLRQLTLRNKKESKLSSVTRQDEINVTTTRLHQHLLMTACQSHHTPISSETAINQQIHTRLHYTANSARMA